MVQLLNFEVGAVQRRVKGCKSDRSRQELSNEYLVAKFGFDKEENEPSQVWGPQSRIAKS